jgi:hypothetical protein
MSQSARLPHETEENRILKPRKMMGFATSSIGTAMPRLNQRIQTRHAEASKRAFRTRFMNLKIFATSKPFKIDVLCDASVNFQNIKCLPATEFARCHH